MKPKVRQFRESEKGTKRRNRRDRSRGFKRMKIQDLLHVPKNFFYLEGVVDK